MILAFETSDPYHVDGGHWRHLALAHVDWRAPDQLVGDHKIMKLTCSEAGELTHLNRSSSACATRPTCTYAVTREKRCLRRGGRTSFSGGATAGPPPDQARPLINSVTVTVH